MITTQNLAKLKFKKAIMDRKKAREKRKSTLRGLKARQAAQIAAKKPKPKLRLDHRNYGAWYVKPEDWEKRFHRKTKKAALEQCLQTRESRHPEQLSQTKTKDIKSDAALEDVKREGTPKETSPSSGPPEMDDEELSQVRNLMM